MKSIKTFKIFFPILLCLCLALTLSSQEGRGKGRIHGTIVDEAGNPVEAAKITAQSGEHGATFEAKSDAKGIWAMGGLGTGYFRITVTKEGYETVQCDMNVSQFSSKNAPIHLTLIKAKTSPDSVPTLQDKASTAIFEEGTQLYEQKKYAEAAAKFEEFLEKNPSVYQVNINIGNSYREMGEYDKALAAYDKVLERIKKEKGSFQGDETAARALANIGAAYIKQGNLEKANEYLKQAIDNYPEDETLAFNVGEIYFSQGNTDKALEYFLLAAKIKEDWTPAHLKLGYVYLNKADYQLALEQFKRFLELAPDDVQAPAIRNLISKLEEMIKKERFYFTVVKAKSLSWPFPSRAESA